MIISLTQRLILQYNPQMAELPTPFGFSFGQFAYDLISAHHLEPFRPPFVIPRKELESEADLSDSNLLTMWLPNEPDLEKWIADGVNDERFWSGLGRSIIGNNRDRFFEVFPEGLETTVIKEAIQHTLQLEEAGLTKLLGDQLSDKNLAGRNSGIQREVLLNIFLAARFMNDYKISIDPLTQVEPNRAEMLSGLKRDPMHLVGKYYHGTHPDFVDHAWEIARNLHFHP